MNRYAKRIARDFLLAFANGRVAELDGLLSQDVRFYRNTAEGELSRAATVAHFTTLRGAFTSLSVTLNRILAIPHGAVIEPRIEGFSALGEHVIVLPMMCFHIGGDGRIYRLEEYSDSASLSPLQLRHPVFRK